MSLDQLKGFLRQTGDDPALRQAVQADATAADLAQLAGTLGHEFSGDEPPRLSGQKVGRVTVTKQDIPGEYNGVRSGSAALSVILI
jgi:predicted ribosomally synthesized peptide with nif11-like leader